MKNNELISRLLELYANSSKHSSYQLLAPELQALLPPGKIVVKSRSETARWLFIKQHVEFRDASVLEVGGNTGYFSFESLAAGARSVSFIEGNREHAEFVSLAGGIMSYENKLKVQAKYYDFGPENTSSRMDVGIVLNVVHHLGDDFGDQSLGMEKAKELMLQCINSMAPRVRCLVFQMGFCWKGRPSLGLFPGGLKQEMIDFVLQGTASCWKPVAIGIPEVRDGVVSYEKPSVENMRRADQLGEFLNRPLFVMQSLA